MSAILRPSRTRSIPCAIAVALAAVLATPSAQAEPSSWLSLGGGYGFQHDGYFGGTDKGGVFTGALGVGSSSRSPFVVGGVFRTNIFFQLGTDISLSARVATGSFARGDWGVALDLGVAGRFWRDQDYGHFPLQAMVIAGAPWGFQLGVGADVWDVTGDTPKARGGFAVIEIDLLRLTAMRSGTTTKWWPNPSAIDGPRPASEDPPPP
jgi:hypothetical protein